MTPDRRVKAADPAGAEVLSFYELTFSNRPDERSDLLAIGVEKGQSGKIATTIVNELQAQSLWPDDGGCQFARHELKTLRSWATLEDSVEYLRGKERFILARFSPIQEKAAESNRNWESCNRAVGKTSALPSLDLINPALDQLLKSPEPKKQLHAVQFFHDLCHISESLAASRGFVREIKSWFQTQSYRSNPLFRIWESHRKIDGLSVIPRLTELRSIADRVAHTIPFLAQLRLGDFYWGGHTLWHLRQFGAAKALSEIWKMSPEAFGIDQISQENAELLLSYQKRLLAEGGDASSPTRRKSSK